MKKIAASLFILLIAGSVSGNYKKMYKKKKKKTVTQAAVVNNTNMKSALMGRSACFGKCPSYTIEVFETGILRYTGKSFVTKEGVYEKNIGANKAISFLKEFNTIRPDTLHYLYQTKVADLPGFYFFISYPDSVKRVINADAGPEMLRDWAQKFDQLSPLDDSWTKK